MSVNHWRGDAVNVAQVVTLTVGSTTTSQTFITTINTKSLTYIAVGGDTLVTISAAIQALLSGSNVPEFQEITWTTDGISLVTGTASTPGVPFVVSVSGTGTYTLATLTASSGSSDASTALNWTLGTVPAAPDDVLIDSGSDILYGLGAISAAAYNSFRVKASFTGNIGLPYINPNGYVEYRTRYWPMNTAVPVTIGEGTGTGPTRVYLSCGSVLALTVLGTGVRQSPAVPAVNVFGFSSGTLNITSGDVGIAADVDTQTGTVTTGTANSTSTLTIGTNATITTLNQDGAIVEGFGTVTTLNIFSGTASLYVAPTTITADGGKVYGYFTGTLATATFRGQGNPQTAPNLDFSNDSRARTITNCSFTGGGYLLDPEKTITFSNAGVWDAISLSLTNFGPRFNLLRT